MALTKQIDRDIYITNVRRQVVERHFLRHLADILPDGLSPEDMEKLIQKDSVEEARKKEIKIEMEILRRSLSALEVIQ